eukprot:TRINITY_DN6316_c0_g1_i1.p3 TRINITY_DN6316_c0_g1~~TRINITY_DN6316_c0_g1_i1.p3  ORF type:complete len:219 (+),score=-40.21 TRINITY_DN6316_c0_g1_i1:3336-3992(+)
MGQKVNPIAFRVSPTLIKNWDSIYYAKKDYGTFLTQDIEIRNYIKKNYADANINKIIIERSSADKTAISIHAQKPNVITGKGGNDINKLQLVLNKITHNKVTINLFDIKKPDIEASLVAQSIAAQLRNRGSFRKAMKKAIQLCMKQGGKGIKVSCSGRLGGAEIARKEQYKEGRVPLHTLRADISYGTAIAQTTYGIIGIKVWIYRGDKIEQIKKNNG